MSVDEEEAWLNEKTALLSSEDTGDTLAAVQVSGRGSGSSGWGSKLQDRALEQTGGGAYRSTKWVELTGVQSGWGSHCLTPPSTDPAEET